MSSVVINEEVHEIQQNVNCCILTEHLSQKPLFQQQDQSLLKDKK